MTNEQMDAMLAGRLCVWDSFNFNRWDCSCPKCKAGVAAFHAERMKVAEALKEAWEVLRKGAVVVAEKLKEVAARCGHPLNYVRCGKCQSEMKIRVNPGAGILGGALYCPACEKDQFEEHVKRNCSEMGVPHRVFIGGPEEEVQPDVVVEGDK